MKEQKHHYIPEFYLKQWAGSDGRLCEFNRPHKKVVAQMKHPSAPLRSRWRQKIICREAAPIIFLTASKTSARRNSYVQRAAKLVVGRRMNNFAAGDLPVGAIC
jgi:hypothetical protein